MTTFTTSHGPISYSDWANHYFAAAIYGDHKKTKIQDIPFALEKDLNYMVDVLWESFIHLMKTFNEQNNMISDIITAEEIIDKDHIKKQMKIAKNNQSIFYEVYKFWLLINDATKYLNFVMEHYSSIIFELENGTQFKDWIEQLIRNEVYNKVDDIMKNMYNSHKNEDILVDEDSKTRSIKLNKIGSFYNLAKIIEERVNDSLISQL